MIFDTWFPFFDVDKTLDEVDRIFGSVGRPLGLRSVPRGAFPAINLYKPTRLSESVDMARALQHQS